MKKKCLPASFYHRCRNLECMSLTIYIYLDWAFFQWIYLLSDPSRTAPWASCKSSCDYSFITDFYFGSFLNGTLSFIFQCFIQNSIFHLLMFNYIKTLMTTRPALCPAGSTFWNKTPKSQLPIYRISFCFFLRRIYWHHWKQ